MKIIIIDTVYPEFLNSLTLPEDFGYEQALKSLHSLRFGTSDFCSRHLRNYGWEAADIVANWKPIQLKWAEESNFVGVGSTPGAQTVALQQIETFKPDVVFLQDLNFFDIPTMRMLACKYTLAGQLSCPWPGDMRVSLMRCLFSSFPHYIPRFEALGVRGVYNPLCFEPSVLQELDPLIALGHDRKYDVVFVGGTGNPSHWAYGMEVLEAVAREIPTARFYGYGYETLPVDSAILAKYHGPAWGLQSISLMCQSRVVINRHGEVSEGYSNNMRVYESCGAGALLLTECSKNLDDFFTANECIGYTSPETAVMQIKWALENDLSRERIARNGQKRCISEHTYERRMKTVSDTLKEML